MLSDILVVALFLFLMWNKFKEGNQTREPNCRTAISSTACKSAGGAKRTCLWCSNKKGGKCVDEQIFNGETPSNCKP